ncbi:MAG: Ig-like domain-containing protein [Clostridia bacterium]|nr:Ig-like domain-containing protein [Clostridia bacterium]
MKPIPNLRRMLAVLLLTIAVLLNCGGCTEPDPAATLAVTTTASVSISSLEITNCERAVLEIGSFYQLETNVPAELTDELEWSASNDSATVDGNGKVAAVSEGKVAVTVRMGELSDSVLFEIIEPAPDIPDSTEREEFYGDYEPAASNAEAALRSEQGLISGSITVPDQVPDVSDYQPSADGKLIRNSKAYFLDENTYVVVNAYGEEVLRVYRAGGYITLEEVAAYVYAFGDVPANYVSDKKTEPEDSIWGEYLRLNHTKFSGNTSKYPYEPELPNISGCGGDLTYYEIDIGTTGNDCDPQYTPNIYNNGQSITRGAARIVYARFDADGDKIVDPDEKYVFYTYNHYNDFQEYLNYFGGWGEMFGNITGGGTISSKYNYNPTPYVETVVAALHKRVQVTAVVYWDFRKDPFGIAA